jgi:polysaccharide pyruvyl transferase WcaK-like protein
MQRRTFLQTSLGVALAASLPAQTRRRPIRLLLCSGWQTVNIGDVAHTPGALALIEEHIPHAEVTLWLYNPLTPEARAMMLRRFPRLTIVEGKLDAQGEPTAPAVLAAMDRCDFFLHGSGPSTLGWAHAEAFVRRTGRGFGVHGVTYGLYGIPEKATLSKARFIFFRDSVSLARAKADGVRAPIMEWGPDTAFAADLRDDASADTFLKAHGLADGTFLCCISRYRFTPFWLIPSKQERINPTRHARNEEKKIADHAPLLAAIEAVVGETELRVLLCPEDETQMAITREMLYDKLPAGARGRVVWRDTFWLPDEAISVYRRSAGLFGHEMHSPIMCIGNGIPAIVCRWAEQSTKGLMWRDIGLGDWLFDFDVPAEAAAMPAAVLAIARDPAAARRRAEAARARVQDRFRTTMDVVSRGASGTLSATGWPRTPHELPLAL